MWVGYSYGEVSRLGRVGTVGDGDGVIRVLGVVGAVMRSVGRVGDGE